MPNCSVFCCKKRSGTSNLEKDGVTFHIFPKDPNLKNTWKKFCNNQRTWDPKRTSVICSTHFQTPDFKVLANKRRRLVDHAIPRLIPDCNCASHQPLPDGANTSAMPNLLTSLGESSSQRHQIKIEKSAPVSTSQSETSPTKRKMMEQIDHQKKKIKRLQAKTLYLKKKVASLIEIIQCLDEKSFIDKEEKMILESIGVEEKELIKRQQKKSESGKLSRAKYSPE